MKCVIFAGGKGSRLRNAYDDTPKPLCKIGNNPIIWHIIKIYEYYGIKDFIICVGYEQHKFKEYFLNMLNYDNDIKIDYKTGKINILTDRIDDINIYVVDTGLETKTGGRLKRIEKYLDNEDFLLTYGDAVSDVNIDNLIKFHYKRKNLITITTVKAKERFGIVETNENQVTSFNEKKESKERRINGGFMVVNKKVLEMLNENSESFEEEVLEKLAKENQIGAYQHNGFWQCMDYQYERELLTNMINNGSAPWMKWRKNEKNCSRRKKERYKL